MNGHDAWNLWVLPPLCVLHGCPAVGSREVVLTQGAYAAADALWIVLCPKCVTRPRVLLVHHLVWLVAIGISCNHPVYFATLRRAFVVEVHSVVHIAARRAPKLLPWRLPTLILCRLVLFPMSFALTVVEVWEHADAWTILPLVCATYSLAVVFNVLVCASIARRPWSLLPPRRPTPLHYLSRNDS